MNDTTNSDVYALVTNQIIAQLEQGTVPWQKPWSDTGIPQNLLTHHPYRGINVWLLASQGYTINYFLTWKQVQSIGATVKKGEKAHVVVFWKVADRTTEAPETDRTNQRPVLRYYWVFNIEQCSGIPEHLIFPITKPAHPIEACEEIIKQMKSKPTIKHKEAEAFYVVDEDFINMPKLKTFKNSESYYATLFHELIHSTGHPSRLNRKEICDMAEFGSELYSTEELTAEIGSCYLISHSGISMSFDNNVAYIQGWLHKLKDDKRFIVYASTQAQRAVDFVLDTNVQTEA